MDTYYYEATVWAYARNVMDGVDETHFAPDEVCSYGQMLEATFRLIEKTETVSIEDERSLVRLCPLCGEIAVEIAYRIVIPEIQNGTVVAEYTSTVNGSTITLTVEPNEWYNLNQLTVEDTDGNPIELTLLAPMTNHYTFTMPESDVSVNATFNSQSQIYLGTDISIALPEGVTSNQPLPVGTTIRSGESNFTVTSACWWDFDADNDMLKFTPYNPAGAIDGVNMPGGGFISDGEFHYYPIMFSGETEPEQITLYIGENYLLDIETEPEGAYYTLESRDPNVLSVDQNGEITAIGCGTTYVLLDAGFKAGDICTVTVIEMPTEPVIPVSPDQPIVEPVTPSEPSTPSTPVTPTDPQAPTMLFTDVHEDDYFYNAVAWAVNNGVTTGTSETEFSPNESCTRAQAVTFLWRAAGSPEPSSTVNLFSDISESAYYYKAVLWALEHGITTGTTTTTFSPDDTCSRAQIVTFLWRMEGEPQTEAEGFQDVDSTQYYYHAVSWATTAEITNGTGNGQFSPNAPCTRAQIVTFLYRDMV